MVEKTDVELWFNNEVVLSDELFNELLEKNKRFVELMIGTKIEQTNTVEYFNFDKPTTDVFLKYKPVIQINSVYVNTNDEFNPVWEAIFDWFYDSKFNKLVLKNPVGPMNNALKVDYDYGLINDPIVDLFLTKLIIRDVLGIMLNRKSYDDEGDVNLGTLKISNSFRYSLARISQLNDELEYLRQQLVGFRTHA